MNQWTNGQMKKWTNESISNHNHFHEHKSRNEVDEIREESRRQCVARVLYADRAEVHSENAEDRPAGTENRLIVFYASDGKAKTGTKRTRVKFPASGMKSHGPTESPLIHRRRSPKTARLAHIPKRLPSLSGRECGKSGFIRCVIFRMPVRRASLLQLPADNIFCAKISAQYVPVIFRWDMPACGSNIQRVESRVQVV